MTKDLDSLEFFVRKARISRIANGQDIFPYATPFGEVYHDLTHRDYRQEDPERFRDLFIQKLKTDSDVFKRFRKELISWHSFWKKKDL